LGSEDIERIEGDRDKDGEELLMLTFGRTSGCTEGDGVSPTASRDGDDWEDGGVKSGVAAELIDGDRGTWKEIGVGSEGITRDIVSSDTPDSSDTVAVGDPVIEESDNIEPDIEVSSEIVTLAIVGLGSVNEATDSVRSREETSDLGRAGMATATGVASSSLDDMDMSVLASLMGI
jgi:hypothetical protein